MTRLGRSLCAALLVACASTPGARRAGPSASGDPLEFAFGTLDGGALTGESTRGRVTALLFVTTFDLPSQAAAGRLNQIVRTHVPRFNAAAIALESAENGVLADVFRSSLRLAYPVATADTVELRASPAFHAIDRVPTLVLLDREGREVRRHSGLFELRELEAWLGDAER